MSTLNRIVIALVLALFLGGIGLLIGREIYLHTHHAHHHHRIGSSL